MCASHSPNGTAPRGGQPMRYGLNGRSDFALVSSGKTFRTDVVYKKFLRGKYLSWNSFFEHEWWNSKKISQQENIYEHFQKLNFTIAVTSTRLTESVGSAFVQDAQDVRGGTMMIWTTLYLTSIGPLRTGVLRHSSPRWRQSRSFPASSYHRPPHGPTSGATRASGHCSHSMQVCRSSAPLCWLNIRPSFNRCTAKLRFFCLLSVAGCLRFH